MKPDIRKDAAASNNKSEVSFPFPFPPYDVQLEFMKHLYQVLEEGKIGILESPTGTGKSLSLICGSLKWLKDYQMRRRNELESQLSTVEETDVEKDDWFTQFAKKQEKTEKLKDAKVEYDFLVKHEAKLEELKKQLKHKTNSSDANNEIFKDLFHCDKKARRDCDDDSELFQLMNNLSDDNSDDQELILENYDSGEESDIGSNNEEEPKRHVMKIYYVSRTHSQLSQFVGELQKSPFKDEVRVTTLGSRQNMCINAAVNKLKSLSLINERCLELQKGKTSIKASKGEQCCPFYKQNNLKQMQDNMLLAIRDIEQTVELGKKLKACPYYGSRYSIADVEVVVLPYNTLLHKSTRDACGIVLKGNIVIIDEAHNLLEAVNNIHSAEITGSCLSQAYCQLHQYQQRYYSRLNPKNLMYIKQLLFVLSSFIKHLGGKLNAVSSEKSVEVPITEMLFHNDFLSKAGIDNINLFKIIRFCEKSQLGRKLHGFSGKYQVSVKRSSTERVERKSSVSRFLENVIALKQKPNNETELSNAQTQQNDENEEAYVASPFMTFNEFLKALINPSEDGRVLSNKQETLQKSSLKFLLLNPATQFQSIVAETRSIIVAGGTMQPISEFIDQLFIPAGANKERISHFSCGHVIPPENLLAMPLAQGPGGKLLEFTYQKRNLPDVMDELGRVLVNLCAVIPGGMVCFFPSYDYEQHIYSYWQKVGLTSRLESRKRIFREPRKTNQVDHVLASYSRCISAASANKSQQNGALLFSVVGGKMSEGINFSDDLGRCVVMVGLPYPNINSPELKEKMNYLNKTVCSSGGKSAGQMYYENLCMKAVNQSIGRAIRHKGDYATIILIDSRYTRPSIKDALPGWISSRLFTYPKFGQAFSAIRQFFIQKKQAS